MKHIAVFASGAGTNARKLIDYFRGSSIAEISLVISGNKNAGVIGIANEAGIPYAILSKENFYETSYLLQVLAERKIDYIVLAGFLWLIPQYLIKEFSGRIVNIHPALLPKFGGKGMYGMNVHRSVKESGETKTGITIHYIDEKYDEGEIIFQAECSIEAADTPEDIAAKVHQLEHLHFPEIVERVLLKDKF